MGPTRYRPQHGQALSRDLDTVFAKHFGWVVKHDLIVCLILDCGKNMPDPKPFVAGRWIFSRKVAKTQRYGEDDPSNVPDINYFDKTT